MVIRTAEIRSSDGAVSRPSENILREGDYIAKVNGQSIRSKQELIDAVKVSNGSPVCLSLLRDGETIEVQVTPQKSQDGTCRLGAWVRDNMQGQQRTFCPHLRYSQAGGLHHQWQDLGGRSL